ncbi:MAG: hypothetical protein KDD45_15800, partial [Bdellovibrionales bacterium]|nr:hypothetical protein [Bdellovibrionales bacterium]
VALNFHRSFLRLRSLLIQVFFFKGFIFNDDHFRLIGTVILFLKHLFIFFFGWGKSRRRGADVVIGHAEHDEDEE